MKIDKATYKRKLLPKSNRTAEFTQMFQCTQCDSTFYNDASYRDHARSHAKVKEFICEYCGITLTKYEQMTKHLDKEHNSDLSYYCYLCYSPAEDKFNLQEHLKYCSKNDTVKSRVNQQPTNSQLLPNLLSGSTMKFADAVKSIISCPKCGQILGNDETLNVQDKPVDVQCKVCSSILTLVRQPPSSLPSTSVSIESKASELLNQQLSNTFAESLLLPSIVNTSVTSPTTNTAPLVLYSQSNTSTMHHTMHMNNAQLSIPSMNIMNNEDANNASATPSMNLSNVAVGSPNHMTVGINTSNGIVVLTLPVVTADKVTSESVNAPCLQLPSGNIILLGDVNSGGSLPSFRGTNSPIPSNMLSAALPTTSSSSSPILPTNDMLMTAAACINSPPSPDMAMPDVEPSEGFKESRLKSSRHTCPHCSKTYDSQQSLRRHVQSHGPKKQHVCPMCNKVYTRPGQLKDHVKKIHGAQEETNNNEVPLIEIKT